MTAAPHAHALCLAFVFLLAGEYPSLNKRLFVAASFYPWLLAFSMNADAVVSRKLHSEVCKCHSEKL